MDLIYQPPIFRCNTHQLALPVELTLKIAENLLFSDSQAFKTIMKLSKSFYGLAKSYEQSIVKSVAAAENRSMNYLVLRSCVLPEFVPVWPLSYMWLVELRSRERTIDNLLRNDISGGPEWYEIADSRRLRFLKQSAFELLFHLADATSGLKSINSCREAQIEVLTDLNVVQLAKIGLVIQAVGACYAGRSGHISPEQSTEQAFEYQRQLRESTCVFEDKVLRYGPFFAMCAVSSDKNLNRWTETMIGKGLLELELFESGAVSIQPSLQSSLWRTFCEKKKCGIHDSYGKAMELIRGEMDAYRL